MHSAIADALAAAASAIHGARTLEETLDAIVHAACEVVPGIDHAGIAACDRDGGVETRAGTARVVWELDELRHGLGEGPCSDGCRDDPVVVLEHARGERWPRYVAEAADRGVKAQLSLRLDSDDLGACCLTLYSVGDTVPSESRHAAELFAAHASIALGHRREHHQLQEAIASHKLIGQAMGIVMERYQIDEERAFQYLARASSTGNIKLRAVAEEVVATTNERFTPR